ncbi:MAG TPA: zinc ABC transporter substrate-binding protein [Clostridia bacterium]|nr:zinc ABC transporter substrate-binding protein [Clostridia bacterium]
MGRQRKSLLIILILIAVFLLPACAKQVNKGEDDNNSKDKIIVYATIYPMYDFTKNIGQDRIDLRMIIPPGSDPHDWEPTPKLMVDLEKADVLVYNGVGMEPWLEKVVNSLDNKDLILVHASEGIVLNRFDEQEEVHKPHEKHLGEYDPHVWLDPLRAMKQVENIKKGLQQADRANSEFYENNYQEYISKLTDLDREIALETSRFKKRQLVVTHAAFGYFAQRYGLEQIPIKGISSQEEPNAAKLVEIVKLLKEKNLNYIYLEKLADPRLSKVLAQEVKAKTAVLDPIGGVTEAEMKQGKDYLTLMRENLQVLKETIGE